jgi:hypothetical protein
MTILHRRALFGAAAGAATLFATPRAALAQGTPPAAPPTGPHTLAPLPYAFDANEAAIDARTMELHWRFHHGAQVNNLNTALRDHAALQALPLDQLLMNLGQVPDAVRTAVRNNGGGHANHTMFWQIMGGRGGDPTGELAAAIAQDFGDIATFRTRFNAAANGRLRQRLGLRDGEPRGAARHRHAAQPGQPAVRRPARADGQRRVGTRLLPALPEPPRGVFHELVERSRLVAHRRALCRGEGRHLDDLAAAYGGARRPRPDFRPICAAGTHPPPRPLRDPTSKGRATCLSA